jgi:hypothetical protein
MIEAQTANGKKLIPPQHNESAKKIIRYRLGLSLTRFFALISNCLLLAEFQNNSG